MNIKARLLALVGAGVAAVLVLVPLPIADLFVMLPMQFFIVMAVRMASGQSMNPLGAGKLVIGYALLGTFLSFVLCNMIFLIGKLFAAPFAFFWCYGLGELTLMQGALSKKKA